MALRLSRSGLSVILLESGGYRHHKATDVLCDGEVVEPRLHSSPKWYRRRCLGGSTAGWAGRCVPLDPIDLAHRPWIGAAGWPIDYTRLAAYYPDANALCEAGEFQYSARLAIEGGMHPTVAGFNPANFDLDRIERFSQPTDFGVRYRKDLQTAANISVWLNATVTRLCCSSDGARVESAEVRSLNGNHFTVRADQFVLASGGLEVPRLLLASSDVHAAGVGNAEDLVGRFYMCHIAGSIGDLRLNVAA